MNRITLTPRPGWEETVAKQGLTFARVDGAAYWDESVAYEFAASEVARLEEATDELHRLYVEAGQKVIERQLYGKLGIPPAAIPLIERSWEEDDASLYGRFDLAYDGTQDPKLLEYNADTPTSLVEAAVAQWFWLQDCHPEKDQFNSIHERLIATWRAYADKTGASKIHLSALRESLEDNQTILYLEDTLRNAKLDAVRLPVEDIGWNGSSFVDWDAGQIDHLFKLYPWEWMIGEEFGAHLQAAPTRFIEPAWKLLFSTKGMLPLLWELFPGHPNLLPAFWEADPRLSGSYVRKPFFSREGCNVEVVAGGKTIAKTDGPYDDGPFVYQAIAPIADFGGQHPILGSWIIAGEASGMGVREDPSVISTNTSRFVPHFF